MHGHDVAREVYEVKNKGKSGSEKKGPTGTSWLNFEQREPGGMNLNLMRKPDPLCLKNQNRPTFVIVKNKQVAVFYLLLDYASNWLTWTGPALLITRLSVSIHPKNLGHIWEII